MDKSIDYTHRVVNSRSDDCPTTERIQALLEDSLSPAESAVVEEHLSTCEHCRTQLETEFGVPEWWSAAKESLGECSGHEPAHQEGCTHPHDWRQLLGPTDNPSMLGRIGSYEVVGMIGRGGMGVVFKAFDGALNRFVAIKMLAPHLAISGAARKRFAREAQAAAAVVDDNVLPIFGVDQWQGVPYFVMQFSRGMTLQKRIQDQGHLDLKEILRVGMQTASGLAAAHAQGLVHRDVKPSNILLDGSVERVLLSDFGLARAVDDASLTRTGTITGTPQYMSPEQVRGGAIDARCDLFSLGCVLYTLCTGRPPFRAESSYAVLRQITDQEPHSIRQLNPEVPEWLEAIVAKLMAKSPTDRFDSAADVADLLEHCLAHVQQPLHSPLPAALRTLAGSNKPKTVSQLPRIGAALATAAIVVTLVAYFGLFSPAAPNVEGKWHDDIWGEIILTPSTRGEYDGTFRGLDGKAQGLIRLRWSRQEGRFNGTWSDGESQSGRISLRPAEGEIRGALTSKEKNEAANSGTSSQESSPSERSQPTVANGTEQKWFRNERPRLGDFVWSRTKPAAKSPAKAESHTNDQQQAVTHQQQIERVKDDRLAQQARAAAPNSQAVFPIASPVPDSWFRRDPFKELGKSPENPVGHVRIALELAAWEPSQRELELTDEQQAAIAELKIMSLPKDPFGEISEKTSAVKEKVLAILTPDQRARLDQLVWQRMAFEGFESTAMRAELKLSKQQQQGIRQAFVDHKQRTLMYDAALAELRQSGKADAQQLSTAAQDRAVLGIASLKKAWDVVYLLLTERQRAKYENLRGTLIKTAQLPFGTVTDSEFTGEWHCISSEHRGVPVSSEELSANEFSLTITGTMFTLATKRNEEAIKCRFTLQSVTSDSNYPYHIDLETREPSGVLTSIQGIIQIRNGLLHFAYGKGRPSSFKTSSEKELDQRAFVFERIRSSTEATQHVPAAGASSDVPDSWFRSDPYPLLATFIENPVGNVRMELELAAFEPAQRELELTPEQCQQIRELGVASLPFDPEGTISEITAQARGKLFAILQLSQRARLIQLVWQRFGYRAFETPAMQTRLELSDEQKQELRQAWIDHSQRVLLLDAELVELRQSGSADARSLSKATSEKRLRGIASYKKAWDAAYSILTPLQRERFNTIRGPLVTVAQKSSKFGWDQSAVSAAPATPVQSRESLQRQLDQEKAKFPLYDAIMAGEKSLGEKLMTAERALFDDREAFKAENSALANDFQQWQRDFRSMLRAKEIIPALTQHAEHRPLLLWSADQLVKAQVPGSSNSTIAKLRETLPKTPSEEQLLQFLCDVLRSDLAQYEGALERSKISPTKEQQAHCHEAEALRVMEDIQTMYIDAAHGSTQIKALKKQLEETEVPPVEKEEDKPITFEDLQEEEARQRAIQRE